MAELRSVDPRSLITNPNNPRRTATPKAMDDQLVACIRAGLCRDVSGSVGYCVGSFRKPKGQAPLDTGAGSQKFASGGSLELAGPCSRVWLSCSCIGGVFRAGGKCALIGRNARRASEFGRG